MNTINVSMQDEFASVLDQIENNSDIRAAVLISKKASCFVAGADIQMINQVLFYFVQTNFIMTGDYCRRRRGHVNRWAGNVQAY